MSEWKQKRFWTSASAASRDGGFAVELDGRPVKTPAKAPLVVPTEALASAIAAEWDAQEEHVDPAHMPFTRMANAAIDKVAVQHAEVAELLAAYGDSDLLCYRAATPEELIARQSDAWDPVLDLAAEKLGARLEPRTGVMHAPQEAAALATLSARVHSFDNFRLAAFHDLVSMTGSLILGFAAAENWKSADDIWQLSRLDELWQEEQWGEDEEARESAAIKCCEFRHAKRFFELLG